MEKMFGMLCRLNIVALLLSCCLGAAGCGRQEEPEGIQDIWRETEQLSYGVDKIDTSEMIEYAYLGSQFWQGESIQIRGVRRLDGCNIYFHKEDGDRELLVEGMPAASMTGKWWIDSEKRCFAVNYGRMRRINSEGKAVFDKEIEGSVYSICQLEDERIVVLMTSKMSNYVLAELDPDSGSLEEFKDIQLQLNKTGMPYMVAAEGNNVLLLCQNGIWDVSLSDGAKNCLVSFKGTSYALKADEGQMEKEAFRVLEDGTAELLWSDGTRELLASGRADEEKKVLTLRIAWPNAWMKEQVVKFNQKSSEYYVTIEELEGGERKDFIDQTTMELGAGKGADIICSNAVNDVYSLLEKGVFEDLVPYMEASGIREEDYFPAAFSVWSHDGKVYGVNYTAEIRGMCIDKVIVGEEEIFGVEDLIDRLLAYDEDVVFWRYTEASYILSCLLQDSETLCGMVDLENGVCDFSGDLFEKLLMTAKRYGYREGREEWKCAAEVTAYHSFYCFNDGSYLDRQGKVPIGFYFDEGRRTEMLDNVLAVNSSSLNKEGAWEFICFMLGEDVQLDFYEREGQLGIGRGASMGSFPVSRSAFEKLCENHLDVINGGSDAFYIDNGTTIIITGLTDERKEELRTALEEARTIPLRTKPLIQIIQEEADAYFSGVKNIDEVREMVQNRVQLYLDERQ